VRRGAAPCHRAACARSAEGLSVQGLLILVALLGLAYFGVAKRRFDFYTAAFGGACIYFSPGFFGYGMYLLDGTWPEVALGDATYAVMLLVMVALLAAAILEDGVRAVRPEPPRPAPLDAEELPALAAGALVGLVALLVTAGDAVFDADKQAMLEGLNRWYLLFEVCAQVGFCLAVLQRRWRWAALFTAMLMFNVFMGFRVGMAMAFAAALIGTLHARGRIRLVIREQRLIALGLAGIVFFMVMKGYIGFIKGGHWDYILANRLDLESVLWPIQHNETFVVAATMNEIIMRDFRWDLGDYFVRAGAAIVPFGGQLVGDVAPFEFQHDLFPRVDYGMASTPWAQAWSAGGWFFLGLVVAAYCGVIALANRYLLRFSDPVRAALLVALAYWCLYIHRNTMEFQLVTERRFVIAAIGLALLRAVVIELRRTWGRRAPGATDAS
jgi:hypothetical protein